ncbi:hypothetical protein ACHAWF_012641 [Thalassiosira exigua]
MRMGHEPRRRSRGRSHERGRAVVGAQARQEREREIIKGGGGGPATQHAAHARLSASLCSDSGVAVFRFTLPFSFSNPSSAAGAPGLPGNGAGDWTNPTDGRRQQAHGLSQVSPPQAPGKAIDPMSRADADEAPARAWALARLSPMGSRPTGAREKSAFAGAFKCALAMALAYVAVSPWAPRIRSSFFSSAKQLDGPSVSLDADGPSFPAPNRTASSTHFPDAGLVLDMAVLSNAVYHLRNKVSSCDDGQARNKTLLNLYRAEVADEADWGWGWGRKTDAEAEGDLFDLLLPEGAKCLLYSHDRSLGTQVLIARSELRDYVAVAYAGTDDWRTALLDGDVLTSDFGPKPAVDDADGSRARDDVDSIFEKVPPGVRVHRGFNSAVFDRDGFRAVSDCVARARAGGRCDDVDGAGDSAQPSKPHRLLTTGHSLGAADSVLLGAALHLAHPTETIRSINFGCPKIGNTRWSYWMDSLQPDGARAIDDGGEEKLGSFTVFRFVNKIDIVPRLPEFEFGHAGHTLQMSVGGDVKAYYDHLGNEDIGYAGVPFGWEGERETAPYAIDHAVEPDSTIHLVFISSKAAPFPLLPFALACHISKHYVKYLIDYRPDILSNNSDDSTNSSKGVRTEYYVRDFERLDAF